MESKNILILAIFAVCCGCGSIFYFAGQDNTINTSMHDSQYRQTWTEFQTWMQKYSRVYNGIEELKERFEVFHNNFLYIQSENQKGHEHWLEVNQFADLTQEEFAKYYLTYKPSQNLSLEVVYDPIEGVPASQDWTNKGPVTAVKDQGRCGSCWAFSSTGGLEAAYYFKTKKLVSFSEQQLVDCDRKNWGCDGGLQEYAYNYYKNSKAELQKDYPYTGKDGSCKYNAGKGVVNVKKYVMCPANEQGLKASVAVRPTVVSVDASNWSYYGGGVFSNCKKSLNHAVLAVGYGTDSSGTKYWKVKNSWGRWGESGYIKLKRTDSSSSKGTCGVAAEPLYPVL